jgi:hypothetical protein
MPITDYRFENRIFYAIESGHLSGEDGREWARRLKEAAEASPEPIVALVDARTVNSITRAAERAFIEASHTPNLLAVVVATNPITEIHSTTIGIMGQRGYTRIFRNIADAQQHAEEILSRASS